MKKGMSSLVVAILLILITVSLAMMFYTWGLKISKGFESTSKNVVENQISQAKTSFFITAVSGREIGIKNNGEAPLDMSAFDVYLNNTLVEVTPNVTILQPGSATTLNITSDFTSGNYSIKVSGPFGKTDRLFGHLSTSSKVWFDSNFKYRMPITISSPNNLNDYQVLITLTPGNFDYSHANSDGSDIRFTDEDKVSPLSYWIEEWNYGSTSKIWVKVPTIPSGSKTIYMYYGNQSSPVTSESDGDSTFLFFDDFDGASLDSSKWDTSSAPSYYSISSGYIRMWGNWNGRGVNTKMIFALPITVELRGKVSDTTSDKDLGVTYNGLCWSGSDSVASVAWDIQGSNKLTIKTASENKYDSGFPNTNWHKLRAKFTLTKTYIWADWSNEYSKSGLSLPDNRYLSIWGDPDGHGYVYYDWILVREYSSPEPTTSLSLGSEEEY